MSGSRCYPIDPGGVLGHSGVDSWEARLSTAISKTHYPDLDPRRADFSHQRAARVPLNRLDRTCITPAHSNYSFTRVLYILEVLYSNISMFCYFLLVLHYILDEILYFLLHLPQHIMIYCMISYENLCTKFL